jgi:hypothetical protein
MSLRRLVVIRKTRRSPVSATGHRGPLARRCHIGVRPTWPHWLALAGMAAFFTRKSHAAIYVASNYLICKQSPHASDIFDSHHPLHSAPQQPTQPIIKRLLRDAARSVRVPSSTIHSTLRSVT